MPLRMPRAAYAALYGPTTGDRVRLADTGLVIEVEADRTLYGEEVTAGVGKVIRDGMGQSQVTRADGAVDTIVTNALVLDHWGIIKADIGLRDGRIAGIGKAGNPDIQPDVDIIIGPGTETIAGEGRILTAGGIESRIAGIGPRQVEEALHAGITTLLGGTGPAAGEGAAAGTPGPWHLARMLQATEGLPVNIGLFGRGSATRPEALIEQLAAGAFGLMLHEDRGATPAAIDNALDVAQALDVQAAIRMDTLNEAGFVEDVAGALKGRTILVLVPDGRDSRHAPEIVRLCGEPHVLPSTSGRTRSVAAGVEDEREGMLLAAQDILHDRGAIAMLASGRAGEVVVRAWQMADRMRRQRGRLPGERGENDNLRVKRYLAKYTINPALAHGIAEHVGSIEIGKLADLVLWQPMFFGVRPDLVLKGGSIVAAAGGDPGAPVLTAQPIRYRPMLGGSGRALSASCLTFVSRTAADGGLAGRLGLRRGLAAVRGTRTLAKSSMILNDATPSIEVDGNTGEVRADGEPLIAGPMDVLPLAQRYFLF